jgi:hypothetical protein
MMQRSPDVANVMNMVEVFDVIRTSPDSGKSPLDRTYRDTCCA